MREIISEFKIILLTIFFVSNINAQVFDLSDYQNFLNQNQNMVTSELLSMHPAGNFLDNINLNYEDALYFDSIAVKYNLTENEKSLIQQHGFVVSERLKKISFGEAILEIYHKDLPVFVSTDAILHAFHISYDRILRDIELGIIIDKLKNILTDLHNSISVLDSKYQSSPEMMTMLKDVDVYITVPLRLLGISTFPYYAENNATVSQILNWILSEQGSVHSKLFSENCRLMDWSQFKPRGHYTFDFQYGDILERYFRTMMWLGRIELYLLPPRSASMECSPQTFQDIQRQIIDAMLINELFDLSGADTQYNEIENIIKIFVGESDNVTLPDIDYLKNAVQVDSANQLLDSLFLVEFQDTLKNQSFAYQLILSQILFSDPMSPDSIIPASAFMLFGQRFIIDSYITGSVVFDRIIYQDAKICRLFPSTLDVLFPLGNNAAAQLLIEELDNYHYSSNLAALRYLIDHYDSGFWNSSMYNYWLSLIRSLNPPTDRDELPNFMQTAAYWQQKMNTQLASWTELRHDNLLYAKQSYTGGIICSYPFSYVEPFPEFYNNLKSYSEYAYNYFSSMNFSDPYLQTYITDYFSEVTAVSDTLGSIVTKELDGNQFTPEEISFLQRMLFENNICGHPYDGWYSKLFYRDTEIGGSEGIINEGLMGSDHIVADIHTTPTDCGGGNLGAITHVGTGSINLGVIVTQNNNSDLTAFVGPVISYYEYTTTNFQRLTDEEWKDTYLQSALRPDWVNLYLADSLGNFRGDGRSLITSVEINKNELSIPQSEILINNYPNPFNPSTIIVFTIPYDLTNSQTVLNIYNIQGKLIRTLVNERLSSGNYLSKWDSKNNEGFSVSSGVYIYNLEVAHQKVSGKMMLIK